MLGLWSDTSLGDFCADSTADLWIGFVDREILRRCQYSTAITRSFCGLRLQCRQSLDMRGGVLRTHVDSSSHRSILWSGASGGMQRASVLTRVLRRQERKRKRQEKKAKLERRRKRAKKEKKVCHHFPWKSPSAVSKPVLSEESETSAFCAQVAIFSPARITVPAASIGFS